MGSLAATKSGVKGYVKSLAGLRYRALVRKAWAMSTQEFWDYQTAAFRDMYKFAVTRVPYYTNHPDLYPANLPLDGNALALLSRLPILEKQTVREHNIELWPKPTLPLTSFHTTSGTTGTPLRLPATVWERGLTRAILEEWYFRICGSRKPRTLSLSGFLTPSATDKELVWVDHLTGNLCLSIYSLNRANRSRIINYLERLKPQLIYGYASAVHQLALLFEDVEFPLQGQCVAVVTSEVLQPTWRTTIESSLCRKVFDMYGSQEGSHLALECLQGQMHINPLVGIIEIVDEQGQLVRPGDSGKVLVTGLIRRSMPLIRYAVGDTVQFTGYASHCACGLSWPTIGRIDGRSEDLVRTRDGRRIGYLCFHATKNLSGIKEAQLVQTGYEQFLCNIVPSETEVMDRHHLEQAITGQITMRLQIPVNIEFRYVDTIPRGRNGKFKAVVVNFE